MKNINLLKRITALALVVIAAAGILACQESTTTHLVDLPTVDDVGRFENYEDLRNYLNLFYDETSNGWNAYRNSDMMLESAALDDVMTTAAAGAPTGADDDVDRTHSVSNDQVEGVKETDTIMTDGYYIYVVSGEKFMMIDADTLRIVYTYTTPETSYSYLYGMFLEGDKVVLLANEYTYSEEKAEEDRYYSWYYYRYGTRVVVLDVADPEKVAITRELFFENTYLIDSRMVEGHVYLVLDNYMINYGFEDDSYIPTYNDSAVSEADVAVPADHIYYMPNDNYSLCYLMLVSFDVNDAETAANVDAYLGSTWQIYMSTTNLYVIMYRYEDDAATGRYDCSTFVLRFEIVDHELVFQAVGEVDGSPLNQFAMDEYLGAFRIVTTEWVSYIQTYTYDGDIVTTAPGAEGSGTTDSGEQGDLSTTAIVTDETVENTYTIESWTVQNSLFVLDATAVGEMTQLGSITEGLGKPDERIYSVRFNGAVGYIVTFENTDPLYKLDLSDPTNPIVVGAWEEDGVSDYLHVINDGLMLGVGREAVTQDGWTRFTGVKIALYDTTGNDPVALDTYFLESEYSYSPVTYDHKAFMYFEPAGADYWYVAIPIFEYYEDWYKYSQSMYVFKAHFDGEAEFVAKLTHNDETTPYYYYYESIERSVIIGSHIYTVSYTQIQMFDMENDFAFVAKTELNEVGYYDYWR